MHDLINAKKTVINEKLPQSIIIYITKTGILKLSVIYVQFNDCDEFKLFPSENETSSVQFLIGNFTV